MAKLTSEALQAIRERVERRPKLFAALLKAENTGSFIDVSDADAAIAANNDRLAQDVPALLTHIEALEGELNGRERNEEAELASRLTQLGTPHVDKVLDYGKSFHVKFERDLTASEHKRLTEAGFEVSALVEYRWWRIAKGEPS